MRLLPFRASRKTIKSICSNQGGEMKILTSLLAAALLFADVGTGQAAVRIAGDRGGRIGYYIGKFQRLHSSGEPVVIDGLCASACTLVLAAVPHDKICVTSRASLGFHAAYDFGANGRTVTNPEATEMLYANYPTPVRRWIDARGGLTPQIIFLRGKQLQAMYQPCESTRPKSPEGSLRPVRAAAHREHRITASRQREAQTSDM
jgi:hypothetical protein